MLSAIYIKGFKTFARPVRMPLEGGITAIVGPNGSGKSNITDAVLFALGEQSSGVLRAGAMSELIFSGSEALPAASAAEVTLVLDNSTGGISLPYREVSLSRRISRGGETEYRINGAKARLQDVKAVAGEAGIGRHSILRQGAVDAIVAGGAPACRLALEEAAGLGVVRRRRLSASRRLERAGSQLDKTRHLEAELASQLRRIEREARAAREYRELEARYRELSLAHLYRVATGEARGLRARLREAEARVVELAASEEKLGGEERALARRLEELEDGLRASDEHLEALEDVAEELRTESGRLDRLLVRVEAARNDARGPSAARLESELRGLCAALERLEGEIGACERERSSRHEAASRARRALKAARERESEVEKERSRLARRLESVRASLARTAAPLDRPQPLSDERLRRLSEATERVQGGAPGDIEAALGKLRESIGERVADLQVCAEEVNRRRGALAAAVGRTESSIRTLQAKSPRAAGTRLYEVLRARPGYEVAVEAALGEFGAGVLAETVDEGMRLLSSSERVAVRLDACGIDENGSPPGRPLLECVEVVDGRYAEAMQRLLAGIYVTEDPENDAPANGYVAVTRDGLRLTRTSVSFTTGEGRLACEARLYAERERLEALKSGPGEKVLELRETLGELSSRLERLYETTRKVSELADRASHARALLAREARRRQQAAERGRAQALERESRVAALSREEREAASALAASESASVRIRAELAAASSAADSAIAATAESDRMLARLRAASSEGREREARISSALERLHSAPGHDHERRVLGRAQDAEARLSAAVRERRARLRGLRARTAESRRQTSAELTDLTRRAAELAGALASARAEAGRLFAELQQADSRSRAATEEITSEWGATLEAARREADRHAPGTGEERSRLARMLKRFGDVNLLALSQQEQLEERYQFVSAQRADAEAAANELDRIIRAIDREIEARFAATFERVREAFGKMVPRMMEGSTGVLELSEEGVEVGLRLGRRGWKPLRVLSGGERALLALSFLFSIFLSRLGSGAGAFSVLDEAEAALDDLNLARFLAVVDSHRADGQYLLVTHQKRTMAAADVLYGVVQDATGATTVVSKRMQGE